MNKPNNAEKNINLRKCVGCHSCFERTSLLRIMFEACSGDILIAPDGKHYGRSVYLCKNDECLKNALKKNKISKVLKRGMSEKDIEKLKNYFKLS